MNKFNSLKQNHNIKRVFYKGKYSNQKDIVVYALKRRTTGIRIAISVGKKAGCAVKRNRIKRIIKAALQNVEGLDAFKGCDMVVAGKKTAIEKKSTQIEGELLYAFKFLINKMGKRGFNHEKSRTFYNRRV